MKVEQDQLGLSRALRGTPHRPLGGQVGGHDYVVFQDQGGTQCAFEDFAVDAQVAESAPHHPGRKERSRRQVGSTSPPSSRSRLRPSTASTNS